MLERPGRLTATEIGTRTALEMPLKPASTSGNRALVCGISPSPPTQPRSELAAAAKSSSSTSKPPRAAKMGSLESTERGASAGAAACPPRAARTTAQAHSFIDRHLLMPFSPPASSAGCLPWALLSVGSGRGQGASGDPAFRPSSKPHILDRLLFCPAFPCRAAPESVESAAALLDFHRRVKSAKYIKPRGAAPQPPAVSREGTHT